MPPTLIEYLQAETAVMEHAGRDRESSADMSAPSNPIRVPLELGGAVWSAEVEAFQAKLLKLVVDREALAEVSTKLPASIRYQPDNHAMITTDGWVTSGEDLTRDKVRLNFELR